MMVALLSSSSGGPPLTAEARRVRAHAEKPANYFRPGRMRVPGDDPRFIFSAGHYRFVFSLTMVPPAEVLRHLSVSTLLPGAPHDPFLLWTAAGLLGFTGAPTSRGTALGPGPDWQ